MPIVIITLVIVWIIWKISSAIYTKCARTHKHWIDYSRENLGREYHNGHYSYKFTRAVPRKIKEEISWQKMKWLKKHRH